MKNAGKNNFPEGLQKMVRDYPAVLQDHLEDDIVSRKLPAGEVWSMDALRERYQSQIADIKVIIPSLIRKGLIVRKGPSTICINALPEAKIESVFQYAQKSNLRPRTIVRDVSIIAADKPLAEKLQIAVDDAVYQQVRSRLVDECVLANQYNFIPYSICPGLEDVDLSRRSFQLTLQEKYHTIITRIEESYALEYPARDDGDILEVGDSTRILAVQRVSYCSSGLPVVVADIHVNPKQFHYVAQLWPGAAGLIKELENRLDEH